MAKFFATLCCTALLFSLLTATGGASTNLEFVQIEASPYAPVVIQLAQASVSVQVPAMPRGTMLFLREVDMTTVAPIVGTHRVVTTPFEFWVEQNGVRLGELDTEAVFDARWLSLEAIPLAVGLYHFHAQDSIWVRVMADLNPETRGFVGKFARTGLFALLEDTTPPAPLRDINTTWQGRLASLTGQAEPLATVEFYMNNMYLGQARADSTGRFRFARYFPPGNHALSLHQLDQAGNSSRQQLDISVTADWTTHVQLQIGSAQALVNRTLLVLEVPPRITQGRTMVPLRFVSEALGAEVLWHDVTQGITITLNNTVVQFVLGSSTAHVDGRPFTLDVAPFVEHGRTLVPVRFLAESLGFDVQWHGPTNSIAVSK